MGTLAGWVLQLVNVKFRKDQSGRVVFLPYGRRKAGYYIDDTADHKKIESLVAIYTASTALFQVLGFLSSYLLAQAVIFPDRPVTRSGKMEVALIVYCISTLVFWFGPRWLLWKIYRAMIPSICSSLPQASSSTLELEATPNAWQRRMLIIFVGAWLILGGVLLAAMFIHLPR